MALRTVGVRLTAEVASYMSNMRRAGMSTKEFVGETKRAAEAGHLDAVADRAGAVGIALTGMAAYAVKSAADFDKSMSAVKAATHASSAEIGQLREAALQAGKDTQYSATGAADAITELSKAGVSTADVLNGGLRGALSLAAAGQLDVGEAAETAASAMVQFRLSGDKIPHIADLLAAGAGKAQGSVHDMGAALNQSGLVASQFNLSIEDTTGVLAEFANAGLTGSDAGTSFKTMLLAIANPSDVTAKKMHELGLSFYDSQGKFIGLGGVADMLRAKLGDLTEEQRQAALGQIFGSDAIRSATILYRDGSLGVQKWKDAVNDAGYASKTAADLTDNLAGDMERLKGSIETVAIEAGGGANGGLRFLVKSLEGMVDRFGELPPAIGGGLTAIAGITGAAALLGAGWVKLRRNTADVLEELRGTGPAGEKAAAGLERTTKWAGRAALAFGAMQVAAVAIDAATGDMNPQVDALASGLAKFSSTGQLSGEAARLLGGDMGKLDTAMKDVADTGRWSSFARGFGGAMESVSGTGHAFDDSLTNSRERLQAVDQALQQLVQGGNAAQAAQIFKTISDRAAEQGVSVNELKKVLPGYAASLETAGKASSGTAGATGDLNDALSKAEAAQDGYKTATDAAAGAVRGERDALISLAEFQRKEIDPVFGLIDAQDKLEKAQKAVTKAIREHGKNSDEARRATHDLALAAIDLEDNVGKLGDGFDGKMTPALRNVLKAGGVTDQQIRILERTFKDAKKSADTFDGKYEARTSAPGAKDAKKDLDNAYNSAHHLDGGRYEAKTSAPGAKAAKADLDKAYTAANNFEGPYRAKVYVDGYPDAIGKLNRLSVYQQALKSGKIPAGFNGPIKGPDGKYYATGGPVSGPGSRTSDSIAAWLSNDEHVLTADEVDALGGHEAVIQIRRAAMAGRRIEIGDEAPGFAAGGPVVWPFPASARNARIPSRAEVANAVIPPVPSGGRTSDWIVAAARMLVPGIRVLSKDRPGAMTLTGNRSYHSMGRAVDFEYSETLARKWNERYMSRTKELISPYQQWNIHNGKRHTYTGAVWRQHNFSGGNPHDHIAMAGGGTISEPIFGFGASGRTYSFGENYQPERVIPNWQGGGGGGNVTNLSLTINAAVGSHPREIGRQVVDAIGAYLQGGGELRINGEKVL